MKVQVLLCKAMLSQMQQTRDTNGVIYDTLMVNKDTPPVQQMEEEGRKYSEAAKDRNHQLGPPHVWAYGALLAALVDQKDTIGLHNHTELKKHFDVYEMLNTAEEKNEMIRYCRLAKVFDKEKRRIVLAWGQGYNQERKVVMDSLRQLGAEHKVCSAPRGAMERELQKMLEDLMI